jgi:transcriptional regulator with PAS, ATPase and Fis domain
LVEKGEFREDLFYRLHVYPVNIPSLNDRRDDIPALADNFLTKFSARQKKKVRAFDQTVMHFLKQRLWRGNIRELENFIERLVTVAPVDAPEITAKMIPAEYKKEMNRISESVEIPFSLQEKLDQYERVLLLNALKSENWNQSAAARALKISEGTLRYKMSKLEIKSR